MSLFDSIIGTAAEKFGLSSDKSGGLLAALLGLMTTGGFSGFLDKFRAAGLGDTVNSWITTGDNTPLSNEQLESALGEDTISSLANQAGVDRTTATSAMAGMIPSVVDTLTPDGEVPDEAGFLSRVGGFVSNWGGAIGGAVVGGLGAAGAVAGGAADKVGNAAGATYDKGREVLGGGVDAVGGAAGAVGNKVSGAMNNVGNAFDGDGDGNGNSPLKWLLPLILLGLLIALGFWFCSKSPTPATNANANANKANTTNANSGAKVNANSVSTANANSGATATGADADRKLTEVSLPDGTKLQAYPGGIEDQLVKFIQSDEYKNGTADSLKEKWFSFDDLNFKFGTTELAPESKRQLDNVVTILKAFPAVKIKIGGYSDKKGNDAANKKLSDDRAKAVKSALEKVGVGAQVPEAEGYGEEFAKVPETGSDEERKADRKTSVRLIK